MRYTVHCKGIQVALAAVRKNWMILARTPFRQDRAVVAAAVAQNGLVRPGTIGSRVGRVCLAAEITPKIRQNDANID